MLNNPVIVSSIIPAAAQVVCGLAEIGYDPADETTESWPTLTTFDIPLENAAKYSHGIIVQVSMVNSLPVKTTTRRQICIATNEIQFSGSFYYRGSQLNFYDVGGTITPVISAIMTTDNQISFNNDKVTVNAIKLNSKTYYFEPGDYLYFFW